MAENIAIVVLVGFRWGKGLEFELSANRFHANLIHELKILNRTGEQRVPHRRVLKPENHAGLSITRILSSSEVSALRNRLRSSLLISILLPHPCSRTWEVGSASKRCNTAFRTVYIRDDPTRSPSLRRARARLEGVARKRRVERSRGGLCWGESHLANAAEIIVPNAPAVSACRRRAWG